MIAFLKATPFYAWGGAICQKGPNHARGSGQLESNGQSYGQKMLRGPKKCL